MEKRRLADDSQMRSEDRKKGDNKAEYRKMSGDIRMDRKILYDILQPGTNFDIVERKLCIGGREAYFYGISGFVTNDNVQRIIRFFLEIRSDEMPEKISAFAENFAAYGPVEQKNQMDQLVTQVLSGLAVLIVDGYTEALVFDVRNYPGRGVQEPEKDKVLRGARDGFTENIIMNTALVRRRIRDPKLRIEIFKVGEASQTDIALVYMEDRVEQPLLDRIRERLQKVKVDALTMSQESLAECIYNHKWFNPFPKFKFTERPDTTAACLLEGHLALLVDNSPSAMVLPASIFDLAEGADDYYFPPITGTYLRFSRIFTSLIALILMPVYILLMENPGWLPEWLLFIRPKEAVNVPLPLQAFILEFAVDGLRLASMSTPNMLSTPLSIIAGIVLGDFSVQSGWFNAEIMLYMAFVTVANYTQTSYELGYAIKFLRLLLLALTAIFGIWGFAAGLLFTVVTIACNKTIGGTSYIYPLIPFRWQNVKRRIFRPRLNYTEKKSKGQP